MNNSNLMVSIANDLFSYLSGSPPIATAAQSVGGMYAAWRNEHNKNALQILLDEFSKGQRLPLDIAPDSLFGLMQRYVNATKQGAARRNLRLLAQTIKEGISSDCPFIVDEIAANADLVSGLTRDEVKILASFARNCDVGEYFTNARRPDVFEHVLTEMVPSEFATSELLNAHVGGLLRTGLIVYPIVWDAQYELTSKFGILIKLCNLDKALSEGD